MNDTAANVLIIILTGIGWMAVWELMKLRK